MAGTTSLITWRTDAYSVLAEIETLGLDILKDPPQMPKHNHLNQVTAAHHYGR
jgi:hypothetical protein